MTRAVTIVALGGIATALICLPLAAALHRDSGSSNDWSWTDHIHIFDDDDSDDIDSHVITRDFAWGDSDRLELDVPAKVHFTPAPQWHLSITGPEKVLDRLRVDDGHIGTRNMNHVHTGTLSIELSGPSLNAASVNGSGKLALDQLKQDEFEINIRGSGSANANGSVEHLSVSIAGSGSAHLERVQAQSTKVSIAGSGDADVAPIDDLDVSIAGSGTVRLHSHPKHMSSHVAGSGQIVEDATAVSAPDTRTRPYWYAADARRDQRMVTISSALVG